MKYYKWNWKQYLGLFLFISTFAISYIIPMNFYLFLFIYFFFGIGGILIIIFTNKTEITEEEHIRRI